MWPHGQAVKTSPFHGGIVGSIPAGVTNIINKTNVIVRLFLFYFYQHTLRFCFHSSYTNLFSCRQFEDTSKKIGMTKRSFLYDFPLLIEI